MTDDLLKRLREYCDGNNDLMDAAADRIEQIRELYLEYVDLAEERAARIKQLEAALRKIADEKNWTEWLGWNGDEEPQDIARAALGEKKDD
jgi:hypothetical protein